VDNSKHLGLTEGLTHTVKIDDIEMLDLAGVAVRLPSLPEYMKSHWIKDFIRIGLTSEPDDPFSIRLEGGCIVLEGGMRELMRLELRRQTGQKTVVAIRARKPSTSSNVVVYPADFAAHDCGARAAC